MDNDGSAKAPGARVAPAALAKKRGLRPHQIMMLLLGALAVFMIVGGVVSLLEESRLPTAPGRTAS